MASRKPRSNDPANLANRQILEGIAQRQRVAEQQEAAAVDLGLDLHKEPETATEFLADEWDRKTFGDALPTYTRVVYGPDPLLVASPEMKARIEELGLEEFANLTFEAVLLKEEKAVSEPMLRKGLRAAIARFGKESVATAFRDRILKIPSREVEIEAEREDDYIFAKPLEEAVMKYGSPGMAPKFLSDRVIAQNGLRGYVIVKDEHGDPVKVGTLIMGEIPIRKAEARRRHWAQESESQVASMEEEFQGYGEREIRKANLAGVSVLQSGEKLSSNAAGDLPDPELTSSYIGRSRETGFSIERQA